LLWSAVSHKQSVLFDGTCEQTLTVCWCRGPSEAVPKLEMWHKAFVANLDAVQRLVKVETWLAHTGRAMQVCHMSCML
jgi:hypothetical protein